MSIVNQLARILRGMPKKNLSRLSSRELYEGKTMLDYVSRMEIFALDLWSAPPARFIKSMTSVTFFWTTRVPLKRWKSEREKGRNFSREIHLAYSAGARGKNFLNTRQTKLSIQFYLVPDNSRLARHTSSRVRVDRIKREEKFNPLNF